MKLKERYYFIKLLFPFQQLGGLHSQFELPFDFKHLKDCEVFAKKLQDILDEMNNETDHILQPEVRIEEGEVKKEKNKEKKE